MRRFLPIAVVGLVVLSASPALADVTPADIAAAQAEIRRVAAELEGRVAEYDDAVATEEALRIQLDGLVVSLAARERELVLARRAARDRAADMYMSAGSRTSTSALVSDEEMGAYPARFAYLQSVSQTDRDVVNRLELARRDFEQQRATVDGAIAEQEQLRSDMDALIESIYSELEAANAIYQEVRAEYAAQEEERRRLEFLATSTTTTTTTTTTTIAVVAAPTTTVAAATTTAAPGTGGEDSTTTTAPAATTTTGPPAPTIGGRACPVDGAVTFRDSWGEARSGGRTHSGTDMMAARWTPMVAIESGYIYQVSWHTDGGLGIYVKGESGALWYYAHSEAVASGIAAGVPVSAGQLIGYVGSSGNAGTPHLHFGWQPNANWVYANPYSILVGLCL